MEGRAEHADRDTQSCLLPQLRFLLVKAMGMICLVPGLSGQTLGSVSDLQPLIFHLILLKVPFKIEVWAVWCRCFEEQGKQKFCTSNRSETAWAALATVLIKAVCYLNAVFLHWSTFVVGSTL